MKITSAKPHSGFTLVEMLIGTVIIGFIFYIVTSFSSNMAFKYKHGFVDLENFRVAHQAINQLRRDFNMACPYVTAGDGINEQKKFLLRPLSIDKGAGKFAGANRRIGIMPQHLTFYKFADASFGQHQMPVVEEVEYLFDSASGDLTRRCGATLQKFPGFKEIEFKSFVHQANPQVPVLWVRMTLDQDHYKESDFGKPLELTVSITSNFVADAINYNSWQYRNYHQSK
ncbi:MAG: hypothetical protein GQF41_0807 [Candidatus Rifleibacterium amylolyticum]|nr:MAG: hypothetical protein GQF41_0807 [Candidatus Rifleibacterium amylolyticum]